MASKQSEPGNEHEFDSFSAEILFYEFGPFRLDLANHLLFRSENEGEEVVHLPPKVFETLRVLVQKRGQVLAREELMDTLWSDTVVEDGNLTRNIATLRKALGEERGEHHYIETIPRRGYRFVAKVQIVTARQLAPMALHPQSALNGIVPAAASKQEAASPQSAPELPLDKAHLSIIKRHPQNVILSASLLLAGVMGILWLAERRNVRRVSAPFQMMEMTRLATIGQIRDVTISPDGNYVAYVRGDAGRQCLRVRQVITGQDVELVPPLETRYRGMTFSPDGNYLFFVSRQKNGAVNILYRLPILGGAAKKLLSGVDSSPTFSPDGSQLAFVRESPTVGESLLIVANADGSSEHRLAVRRLPAFFSVDGPAWSPDGKQIACASANFKGGLSFQVVTVNVTDGSEAVIGAQQWLWMKRLAWLPDGSGLLMPARQQRTSLVSQIWQLTYPTGEARRVTHDLHDYHGLSLTADANTLVTVQVEALSTLWVMPRSDPSRATQITSGRQDGYHGLSWTPDDRIVYSATEGNSRDLWVVHADGSQPERLTSNAGDNFSPTVSRDGQFSIFLSNRSNAVRVWRMALDGSQIQELTHGDLDQRPTLSPDQQWVVYSSIQSGKRTLWKVPVSGGGAVPLTDKVTEYPAISTDGQMISCLYRENASSPSIVAVLSFSDGAPLRFFDLPTIPWPLVRWLPAPEAEPTFIWIETSDEISNLWSQPFNGGTPTRLTDFKTERIFDYAWSHDGQRLACARGAVKHDVVMLNSLRQ
jgi:Tol biopolymer transport system component/DNA-binding winged helix-turn-helix (wHTH) protein